MSDDENYEIEDNKAEDETKIRTEEKLELNKMIQTILSECQKSQPIFPVLMSKKICQANGLQCTEDTFFSLMSNVVEYSLNDVLSFNKDIKSGWKYKKEGSQNQLKTIDVQKYFETKNINIAKSRCYPEIALEKDRKKVEEITQMKKD